MDLVSQIIIRPLSEESSFELLNASLPTNLHNEGRTELDLLWCEFHAKIFNMKRDSSDVILHNC